MSSLIMACLSTPSILHCAVSPQRPSPLRCIHHMQQTFVREGRLWVSTLLNQLTEHPIERFDSSGRLLSFLALHLARTFGCETDTLGTLLVP